MRFLVIALLQVVVALKSKPNVVFILIDDTGYNDLGYHNRSEGKPGRILTPNLDALADGGVKLANYYVQPICTPTRAALMTGRYAFRYGVTGYTIGAEAPWGIPINETFLPQFLGDAGYSTAMFGKVTASVTGILISLSPLVLVASLSGILASSRAIISRHPGDSMSSRASTTQWLTTTPTKSAEATTGT